MTLFLLVPHYKIWNSSLLFCRMKPTSHYGFCGLSWPAFPAWPHGFPSVWLWHCLVCPMPFLTLFSTLSPHCLLCIIRSPLLVRSPPVPQDSADVTLSHLEDITLYGFIVLFFFFLPFVWRLLQLFLYYPAIHYFLFFYFELMVSKCNCVFLVPSIVLGTLKVPGRPWLHWLNCAVSC